MSGNVLCDSPETPTQWKFESVKDLRTNQRTNGLGSMDAYDICIQMNFLVDLQGGAKNESKPVMVEHKTRLEIVFGIVSTFDKAVS